MIRYFPMPYPDETMYSIFVRYSKHVGNKNLFITKEELLGKMHLIVNNRFVSNVTYICENLPNDSIYTQEYFIDNHTIMPIYKPFVPLDRYKKSYETLKLGNLNSVYSSLGITAGTVIASNHVNYCPKCTVEDKALYGEAYIHRIHQVEGVLVCPKHNIWLMSYEFNSNDELIDIDEIFENISFLSVPDNRLFLLAKDFDWLLSNYEKLGRFHEVKRKYNSGLIKKGYMSVKGLIKQVDLHNDFNTFYTSKFLSIINSDADSYYESSWLRVITRKKIKVVNPIRNLLFIRFLFGDLENFILYNADEYKLMDLNRISNIENKEIKKSIYNMKFEYKYKEEILGLIENEPNFTRSIAIKKCNKAYRWLYKYYKDWLESMIPVKENVTYRNARVNWADREKEILLRVKQAVDDIVDSQIPRQITLKLISEKIKYKSLPRNLCKMPLLAEYINSSVESIKEYHERKLQLIIERYVSQGRKLVKHKILRDAGISDKYYHDYDDYLSNIIEKYISNYKK